MASLRRILKLLLAFIAGQGITVLGQLLIPPLFLHRFANGIAVYGEWIALSAAVSYLGSLNYGVQTYAVNQMTIHRNRGELLECRTVQASALRLMEWLMLALLPVVAAIALLPVADWLHLRAVANGQARLVLELLLFQLFAMMVFSLLANSFTAVGRAHRGANWNNALRLASTLALGGLVWMRASFAAMAASQLALAALFALLVIVDLRRTAPEIAPSLRYARNDAARAMARPSWHFTVLALSAFLTWQAPVLLMQRILGPAVVGAFALTRTIFTMSRQALAVASMSMSPEITSLVGARNWKQLKRLYDLSERVVLFLVPVVNVATLLASPLLLSVWLRRRNLYEPGLCLLMAMTSAAMGIKEHKYQFQASSNRHEELSRVMLAAYGLMLLVSTATMRYFGADGFMATWLLAETALAAAILGMNRKLFPAGYEISAGPLWKLVEVLALVFAAAAYPAFQARHESLAVVTLIALAATAATALLCYRVFGLSEVARLVISGWRAKKIPAPAPQSKHSFAPRA